VSRRGTAVAEPDTAVHQLRADLEAVASDRDRLASANAVLADQLDIVNGRADRMQRERDNAQAALRDTAADVAAMHDAVLPSLAAIHPGPFDEPMPEDARVTKAGKCLGTWEDVTGDRGEDYGTVEAVDFGALYALIGAELVAA
jgi:hypothetical protein